MPLVNMADMLYHAYRNMYAVGAFHVVDLEFLEGIMAAAEGCRAPVILNVAETHFDCFDPELLMPAVEAAARRSRIPVAIHFDHGTSLETAVQAIRLGCNGVMVDASHLHLGTNIDITRQVAEMAHGCGVPVEGEIGCVPHPEGEPQPTSVAEARAYVEKTGVDFLAVSIGTIHGPPAARPRLDFGRLRKINEALGIPLVIHGGTGLSEEQCQRLIANGVAKINYYTALADAAGKAIEDKGYAAAKGEVRAAVAEEAARCMRLWGSAGRAAEVLVQCRPWHPVEHVILWNSTLDAPATEAVMAEGRRRLRAIPGVTHVRTGRAVDPQGRYRYCWLIGFASAAVIPRYREHPDHTAFANTLFRPAAPERITVDFEIGEPQRLD